MPASFGSAESRRIIVIFPYITSHIKLYVTSLAQSFQVVVESFPTPDNRKQLIKWWTSQVPIKRCPDRGKRFLVVKISVSLSCE